MINIPSEELETWLSDLKPYQAIALRELMTSMTAEDAAKNWITASGSQNIVQFGGSKDREPFWDRFREEFNKFICDEKSYVDEKIELQSKGELTRTYLIGAISTANWGYNWLCGNTISSCSCNTSIYCRENDN
jgi:hypothetical protein